MSLDRALEIVGKLWKHGLSAPSGCSAGEVQELGEILDGLQTKGLRRVTAALKEALAERDRCLALLRELERGICARCHRCTCGDSGKPPCEHGSACELAAILREMGE